MDCPQRPNRTESGVFPKPAAEVMARAVPAHDAEVRVALTRLDALDRRLASDVAAAHAVSPAIGLVLECLRLQLLVAAERLLVMASCKPVTLETVIAARELLGAYKSAIMDASGAVIRVRLEGPPRAA